MATLSDLRNREKPSAMPHGDPYGQHPLVDPISLRRGVDLVCVRVGMKDRVGIWLGHYRGRGAAKLDGERIARIFPAVAIREPRPLPASLDWCLFEEGYHEGGYQEEQGARIRSKEPERKPSDFSRGFLEGYTRRSRYRPNQVGVSAICAFNDVARRLAIEFPGEHWVGAPP